jgi:hypothetical protein
LPPFGASARLCPGTTASTVRVPCRSGRTASLPARDSVNRRFERRRRQARDQRRRVADLAAEVMRGAGDRLPTGGSA